MENETLYEEWRSTRSRSTPSDGFADRVMHQVELLPLPAPSPDWGLSRTQRLVRVGLCAAAVVAAVFRLAELLSVFAATGIEN
jgi:hypothetical protein